MSKPITKTLQERLKIHMALFTLLTYLLSGFDLNNASDLPPTRVAVIIYVGLLMMWAFIVDAKRPSSSTDAVQETLQLLYLDLKKLFSKAGEQKKIATVADIEQRIAELRAQLAGMNTTASQTETVATEV